MGERREEEKEALLKNCQPQRKEEEEEEEEEDDGFNEKAFRFRSTKTASKVAISSNSFPLSDIWRVAHPGQRFLACHRRQLVR